MPNPLSRLPPPKSIDTVLVFGARTVRALRRRAIERQLQAGTYNRIITAEPAFDLGRVAIVSAITILLGVGIGAVWLRGLQFGLSAPDAIGFEEARRGLYKLGIILIIAAVTTPILVWASRTFRPRARILALRAGSDGAELSYDNGTRRLLRWSGVIAAKGGTVFATSKITLRGLECFRPRDFAEWNLFKMALGRTHLSQKALSSTRSEIWAAAFGWVGLSVFSTLMFVLSANAEQSYGHSARTPSVAPGVALTLGIGFSHIWGLMITMPLAREIGLHRIGLRLRQAFRRSKTA